MPAVNYSELDSAQRADETVALETVGLIGKAAPSTEAAVVRAAMDTAGEYLTDEQAELAKEIYPFWEENIDYRTGDRRREDGALYKCLQGHRSQRDWTPSKTPALWVEISVEEWPLIPNPIPSTNPWMKDQKGRTTDGRKWISLQDHNTWQPDEHPAGWQEVLA